jgi:CMP-N-acetylneuraminic acid synthetase
MRRLAILPARGGSKRFPGKNIVDFFGRPIIAYTIEAALEAGLFERVVVSSDDPRILDVSRQFGAEVDRRPDSLATDGANLVDVCLDFLDREADAGRAYDQFCMIHATSPLRRAEDIRRVVELLEPGVCEFAAALTTYNLPAHQALKLDKDGFLTPMWPELAGRQSHELPPLRAGNGSTYAASVKAFREQRTFFGRPLRGHPMSSFRSVDIDVEEEWLIAKLFKAYLDRLGRG